MVSVNKVWLLLRILYNCKEDKYIFPRVHSLTLLRYVSLNLSSYRGTFEQAYLTSI